MSSARAPRDPLLRWMGVDDLAASLASLTAQVLVALMMAVASAIFVPSGLRAPWAVGLSAVVLVAGVVAAVRRWRWYRARGRTR